MIYFGSIWSELLNMSIFATANFYIVCYTPLSDSHASIYLIGMCIHFHQFLLKTFARIFNCSVQKYKLIFLMKFFKDQKETICLAESKYAKELHQWFIFIWLNIFQSMRFFIKFYFKKYNYLNTWIVLSSYFRSFEGIKIKLQGR